VAVKDWVGIAISCVALTVSAGSAYFNVLLQRDDIRVVVGRSPFVEVGNEGQLTLAGDQDLTFINSGNRQAAITNFGVFSFFVKDQASDDASCFRPLQFPLVLPYEVKPLVLKPGEVMLFKAELKNPGNPWKKAKDGGLTIDKKGLLKSGEIYVVCLGLTLITPDNYTEQWRRPVFKLAIGDSSEAKLVPLFQKDKPLIVLARTNHNLPWATVEPDVGSALTLFRAPMPPD
jgi:hypothetical protein